MPLIAIKLISSDDLAELNTAVATYKAGDGSELDDSQRGMASDEFIEADADFRILTALAHGGLDIPVAAAKTAVLQHLIVKADGNVSDLQTALDLALSNAVHETVADGVTTAAGVVTSVAAPFEAEDVGRKIRIGAEVRTITVHNGANSVDYDNSVAAGGDFVSGTGKTVELLGAEVLQAMSLKMQLDKDRDFRMHMMLAVEGELS